MLAPLTNVTKAKDTATAALIRLRSEENMALDRNSNTCSARRGFLQGCSEAAEVTSFDALLTKLAHKPDSIQGVGKDKSLCIELMT
jgi:hypothetical protein